MLGRRVVVTGCGVVTPVGIGVKTVWENLLAGTPGAAPIVSFDAKDHSTRFACEVRDWDPRGLETWRTNLIETVAETGADHRGRPWPER